MDRAETKQLIIEIVKVYPKFEANLDNWAERLSGLSPERGMKILNKWIEGDRGDYTPTLAYFIKQSKAQDVEAFMDMTPRQYHVSPMGELLDEEGREYGGTYEDGSPYRYYYDTMGRICRKDDEGREVVVAR